jgi:hypothetical protein
MHITGADPGFQVRGGALKKIAPRGGRREQFWGISCEKLRFYAKKSYFSNCGGRRENFWVSRVKNHDFTPKNHIFSNFRAAPPPGSAPVLSSRLWFIVLLKTLRANYR